MTQKAQCPVCNSFYNASKFTSCPYCMQSPRSNDYEQAQRIMPQTQNSSFPQAGAETRACTKCGALNPSYAQFCKGCGNPLETETPFVVDDIDHTMPRPDISGMIPDPKRRETSGFGLKGLFRTHEGNDEGDHAEDFSSPQEPPEYVEPIPPQASYPDPTPYIEQNQSEANSLQQEFDRVGRTVGKWIQSSEGEDIQPVVGWIVGVKGCYFGQSFNLKKGKNRIGRSTAMDIKLLKDDSVSRTCVATLFFDVRSNEFSLLPGESDSLCYLNGKALYERIVLKGYEEIEFGDSGQSKYVFVPFLGSFLWTQEGDGDDNVR